LNFEAAMQRNEEAERAEQNGDPQRAIDLYEKSVAEGFVGSHPYERLASIYELRRNHDEALRVCEAFLRLAASGNMPQGAQRRADRRIPEIRARAERYRNPA
jgi:tetratricopeptide (TPR) repeat protein